jgi:hypothetical protein
VKRPTKPLKPIMPTAPSACKRIPSSCVNVDSTYECDLDGYQISMSDVVEKLPHDVDPLSIAIEIIQNYDRTNRPVFDVIANWPSQDVPNPNYDEEMSDFSRKMDLYNQGMAQYDEACRRYADDCKHYVDYVVEQMKYFETELDEIKRDIGNTTR